MNLKEVPYNPYIAREKSPDPIPFPHVASENKLFPGARATGMLDLIKKVEWFRTVFKH